MSIPVSLCQKLCDSFIKRIQLCKKYNGRRLDRELLRQLKKSDKIDHKWFPDFYGEEFKPERIVYNDTMIKKLKKKHITKLKKEIVEIKRQYRESIRYANEKRKSMKSSRLNFSYFRLF